MTDAVTANPFRFFRTPRLAVLRWLWVPVVLWSLLRFVVDLYTEQLWFEALDAGAVWNRQLVVRLGLSVSAFALTALAVWGNLWLAQRAAVVLPAHLRGPTSFTLAGKQGRWSRVAITFLCASVTSPIIGGRWQELLMFLYGGSTTPIEVTELGASANFYLFSLPFLASLLAWFIVLALICASVSVLSYFVSGSLRRIDQRFLMTERANTHLSILLALFCLTIAAAMWFARFGLASGSRGDFVGLLYTDRNVRLPAYGLLGLAAAIVGGSAAANVKSRNWSIPTVGVVCWLLVSAITLGVAPAVVQSWTVSSNKEILEAVNLKRHIDATLSAYGLDQNVASPSLTRAGVPTDRSAQLAASNVRIWDPSDNVLLSQVRSTQEGAQYYRFGDVDLDRYTVNGKKTFTAIGVREIQSEPGWVNRILKYTHGFGAVLVDPTKSDEGRPVYRSADSPARSRVYFGQLVSGYVVAGTTSEFSSAPNKSSVDIATGIRFSSGLRRAAFALRLGDLDIIRGRGIRPDSQLLIRRNVVARARALAPFLRYDSDPYPVVLSGRLVWVVDAYTTSNRFPGAQRHSLRPSDLSIGSELASGFNYVRNSVRVVVDAEEGTTRFYRTDLADPVAQLWSKVFPKTFRSVKQMEADFPGIGAHFRYPADLLAIQSSVFGAYHHGLSGALLSGENRWVGSPDVVSEISDIGTTSSENGNRAAPMYRMVTLPGERVPLFTLTQTLERVTNSGSGFVSALLSGRVTATGQNQLRFSPVTEGLPSVSRAASAMSSDPIVSALQTRLSQKGTKMLVGAMQLVPVPGSTEFVYARPLYTVAQGSGAAAPARFVDVIVFDGDRVVVEPTAEAAFKRLARASATADADRGEGSSAGALATTPQGVIDQLAAEVEAAREQLKVTGDVVEFQTAIERILKRLEIAGELGVRSAVGGRPATTVPSDTPSPE